MPAFPAGYGTSRPQVLRAGDELPAASALPRVSRADREDPSQLAIAWVLAKSKGIVPVIGVRMHAQLDEILDSEKWRVKFPGNDHRERGGKTAKGPRCGAPAARDGQCHPPEAEETSSRDGYFVAPPPRRAS